MIFENILVLLNFYLKNTNFFIMLFSIFVFNFITAMKNVEIEKYTEPFLHYKITDFLGEKEYLRIKKIYNNIEFVPKHTDLFSFLQTSALEQDSRLDFFRKRLLGVSKSLNIPEDSQIDLFASYYRKGDYLLPHDDINDDRRYAFSYYLDDYDSGELLFYNEKCDKVEKINKVTKNTIIIFEVSYKSWHEVAYCNENGRSAFTGWLSYKDTNKERINDENEIKRLPSIYKKLNNPKFIKLEIDLSKEISVIKGLNIKINYDEVKEQGPFYERRIGRIPGSKIIFDIPGLQFVSVESFYVRNGDFLLLNDNVNEKRDYEFYNIFYFKNLEKDNFSLIKFADTNGTVEFEVDCLDDHLFAIKGNDKVWFIERTEKECLLEHFIYKVA